MSAVSIRKLTAEHPDAYDVIMEWERACDTRWNEITACGDGSIGEYLKTFD